MGCTSVKEQRLGLLPESSLGRVIWPQFPPVKSEIWHPQSYHNEPIWLDEQAETKT